MATPVILPKQGNSVESCIIQQWLKQPGDSVSAGEAICEVETDKAVMEVEAPADGVLLEVFFQADDDVPVLETIAAIGATGEDASELRPSGGGAAPAAAEPQAAAPTPSPAEPVASAAPAPVANGNGSEAGSSPRARALAADKGVDVAALGGSGPGGRVIERDVQAAVATGPRLSPAAQARLADGGLEAPAIGSGPAGLVRVEDLVAAGQLPPQASSLKPQASGSSQELPVKGVRKIIAERMRQSLATTAQLTMTASARIAALQAYRARVKARAEDQGLPNITIGDMLAFAVSRVLPRFPELNAHFLGDRIVQFADVNLGIAVDTPRGLMVPVVPAAQRLSLAALAAGFKPVAQACIAGNPDPERLQGGTFTITNLGALGIEHFTPVLNAPEVAILGVGAPQLKPVRAADGAVEHHDVVGLSLTIDHQALDGAPAARFLQALTDAIEHFDLLLAD